MAKNRWLVAVTAGRWQLPAIEYARNNNIGIIAIDGDRSAEGLKLADISIVGDIADYGEIIKKLEGLDLAIGGVVSFCSEAGMLLAAKIREHFKLLGPDFEHTQLLINKLLQRRIWSSNNVPGPQWKSFSLKEEALLMLRSSSLPVIIKPVDSAGSRGVTKVESFSDNINEIVDRAFQYSKTGEILIESFLDGVEFTVEIFAANGDIQVLAVTEKKKVHSSKGVVANELMTPNRAIAEIEKLQSAVVAAFQSLEYLNGPGHAEIILCNDGSVGMVEVAGRGGGFMLFEGFVPAVSGIDVVSLTVEQALGEKIVLPQVKNRSGVLRFFPSELGKVISISGLDEASKIEGVEVGSFVKVGDLVNNAATDGDRLGYILVIGDSQEEILAKADRVENSVKFEIERRK